ncbi:MAG: HupE/UreJ family protein [Cocleimonas sp.]|nr:HupE/UreJ family protein [Cocleimonas sp.]
MIVFSSTWFLDGFTHPLETPSHLILLVALGVLIGQQSSAYLIRNLLLFCASVFVGFIINNYLSLRWNNELILLSIALLVSLLIVLRLDYRQQGVQIMTLLLSISSGIMLGIDSSPIVIPGLGANTFYNWLFGAAIGIILAVIIIASISALLRNVLEGIILRVLGSWIATSALFVLTLLMVK